MNMKTIQALFLSVVSILTGCNKAYQTHINAENSPPLSVEMQEAPAPTMLLGSKEPALVDIYLPNGTKCSFYQLENRQWVATVVDYLGCVMQEVPVQFTKELPSMKALTSLASAEQERWIHIENVPNGNKIVYLGKVGLMGGGFYRAHTCDKAGCDNKWRVCERCEGNACNEGTSTMAVIGFITTHFTTGIGAIGHAIATEIHKNTGTRDPRDGYETIQTKRYCWTHCSCSGICKRHCSCPDCDKCIHCKGNCKQCCDCAARIKRDQAAAEAARKEAARKAEQYFRELARKREEERGARAAYYDDSSSDSDTPAFTPTSPQKQQAQQAAFQAAFACPTGANATGKERTDATPTAEATRRV